MEKRWGASLFAARPNGPAALDGETRTTQTLVIVGESHGGLKKSRGSTPTPPIPVCFPFGPIAGIAREPASAQARRARDCPHRLRVLCLNQEEANGATRPLLYCRAQGRGHGLLNLTGPATGSPLTDIGGSAARQGGAGAFSSARA